MTRMQISERIGNIDDQLIQEAGQLQKKKWVRKPIPRKLLVTAAVLMLVLLGGTVGTFALGWATPIEVKLVDGVETITIKEIGLTMILPDGWEGRCVVEKDDSECYRVYNASIREAVKNKYHDMGGGLLFDILRFDERLTREQFNTGEWWGDMESFGPIMEAMEYIGSTKYGTYVLFYESAESWTPETRKELLQMRSEIKYVRFVIDDAVLN